MRCITRLIFFISICILFGNSIGFSRVYIDITEPSFKKLPIAIPDFRSQTAAYLNISKDIADVLRNDLKLSGAFNVLNPAGFLENPQKMGVTSSDISFSSWKSLGADYLVTGLYSTDGISLHLELRFFDVISGKMLLGQAYDGKFDTMREMVHRFADEILKILTGEPGVFSTKIAFVNKVKDAQRLYMVDFDGYKPLLLTPEEKLVVSPTWDPEGKYIAYVSYIKNRMRLNLFEVASGSISSFPNLSEIIIAPRFHPTKPLLAVTLNRNKNSNIYLVSMDGTIVDVLITGWSIDIPGSWSPDGRKLAYVSGETGGPQVYVYDLDTRTKYRLTYTGDYNTSPSWSPDGEWIAYSSRINGYHQIFITRPDGSEVYQLTYGNYNNEAPVWSPDGRMIAFQSNRKGKYSIWVMLKNGREQRLLTNMEGEQKFPAWSPRF